ncbi:unnamed protein product [Darwinula stevensoni]|uniref:Uncharacterized protein n=1 Tax=Darwinula stevensoni TaxID=69355 RepID=A0A7R9FS12_9CRUS|nr:unnamed protein product [Darwinula stevensoni]CAG0902312.1 unnamed protein product [Darwinula stevensoni]
MFRDLSQRNWHCSAAKMSSKYNLKWNSHHAEAFHNFEILRHRDMFVDVTLSCDGQFFKAHKLVLSAGSGYFERMLNRDGTGTPIIHFYGIEMHLLKLVIEFMYSGEVEVPSLDLERFIEIAEHLEVKGLKGEKSKSSFVSHGMGGTTIPVAGVEDALAHKRKSSVHHEYSDSLLPPAKLARSHLSVPRVGNKAESAHLSSQMGAMQQPQQGPSSVDTIKQEDEVTEIHDDTTQSSTGAPGSADEGQWDGQSQSSYYDEGMEGEPDIPLNIPPEVDSQTIFKDQDYVWCGWIRGTRKKKYFCAVCDYSHKKKDNMVKHSSTHNKLKRFKCALCDKNFARNDYLKRHVLMRHPDLCVLGM